MKNLWKSAGLSAIIMVAAAAFVSCDENPGAPEIEPAFFSTPKNLRAEATLDEATLIWDRVKDATGYELRFNGEATSHNTTDNSYIVKGLTPETEYEWTVRALRGNETTDWATGSFTTRGVAPWSYYDMIGNYFGTANPVYREMIGSTQQPGNSSWMGTSATPGEGFAMPGEADTFIIYIFKNPFGMDDARFPYTMVDIVKQQDGSFKFYLNDENLLYQSQTGNTPPFYVNEYRIAAFYLDNLDDIEFVPLGDRTDKLGSFQIELTYDPAARTLTFPNKHNGRDIAIGVVRDQWYIPSATELNLVSTTPYSDGFTDIVLAIEVITPSEVGTRAAATEELTFIESLAAKTVVLK